MQSVFVSSKFGPHASVILIGLRPASFTQKNHKGHIIAQVLGSQGRIIFQQMKYIHHNFIVSICKFIFYLR